MTIASSSMDDRNHSDQMPALFSRVPLPSGNAPVFPEGDPLGAYVDSSEEAWRAFIEAGLASSFYYTAREHMRPFDAAAITLLKSYLDTFFPGDRAMVEGDPDCFFRYADAFLRELSMPDITRAPELPTRPLLLGRVKHLLKERAPVTDGASRADRHAFIAAVLKLCSSMEHIVRARDVYKEYMFRIYPQLHIRVA